MYVLEAVVIWNFDDIDAIPFYSNHLDRTVGVDKFVDGMHFH